MNEREAAQLAESIYYLKVEELRHVCRVRNLPEGGAKGSLIKRVLNDAGVESENHRAISVGRESTFRKYSGHLNPDTHILPGYYTNGPRMRAKLRAMIGDHFAFTNYGMEWIRERWTHEEYPTYEEFAAYWNDEHKRRKEGGAFESLPTNARVRFFRSMEGKGLSRGELDRQWRAERRRNVAIVSHLLNVTLE